MAQNLPLQDKIAQSSAGTIAFRRKSMAFGDGYSQRVPDGLNYTQRKWTINWMHVNQAEFDTLNSFVHAHGGGAWFYWQPPGVPAPIKWVIDGDTKWVQNSGNIYTVTITISQVYDLV